jgi:hypothetical protein
MCIVRKTAKGKFKFELDIVAQAQIHGFLCQFLEQESKAIRNRMSTYDDAMRHLNFSVLHELLKLNFHNPSTSNFLLTRAQAVALAAFLRRYDDHMDLLNLKVSLHKQLIS